MLVLQHLQRGLVAGPVPEPRGVLPPPSQDMAVEESAGAAQDTPLPPQVSQQVVLMFEHVYIYTWSYKKKVPLL